MNTLLVGALLLQAVATARPAAAPVQGAETRVVAPDSVAAGDTAGATLAFDFGAGLGSAVAARRFDFTVNSAPVQPAHSRGAASALLRVTRAPDTLSAELARRALDGGHIGEITVRFPGQEGRPGALVHLYDVQVVSSKLVSAEERGSLLERRYTLDESIDQLGAELEEAQRQQAVTESLRKRDLSTALELARARAATALLTRRLAIQRQRLALLTRELSRWTPAQEESVFSAARVVIDDR